MRTVGVAPGSYTLQLGACPPDGYGTGAYGVTHVGQYDLPNNWFGIAPEDMGKPYSFDPYARMRNRFTGLGAVTPDFQVLGIALGVVAAVAVGIGFLARPKRKRR